LKTQKTIDIVVVGELFRVRSQGSLDADLRGGERGGVRGRSRGS